MKKILIFSIMCLSLIIFGLIGVPKVKATTYYQGVNKVVMVSKNKYSQTTKIYASKDRANQMISSGLIYSGFVIPGVGTIGKFMLSLAGVWTRVPGGFYFTCTTYYPSILTGGKISSVYSGYKWQ